MVDIVLSFNWQNIFTIWLMIILLVLAYVVGSQLVRKMGGMNNAE